MEWIKRLSWKQQKESSFFGKDRDFISRVETRRQAENVKGKQTVQLSKDPPEQSKVLAKITLQRQNTLAYLARIETSKVEWRH